LLASSLGGGEYRGSGQVVLRQLPSGSAEDHHVPGLSRVEIDDGTFWFEFKQQTVERVILEGGEGFVAEALEGPEGWIVLVEPWTTVEIFDRASDQPVRTEVECYFEPLRPDQVHGGFSTPAPATPSYPDRTRLDHWTTAASPLGLLRQDGLCLIWLKAPGFRWQSLPQPTAGGLERRVYLETGAASIVVQVVGELQARPGSYTVSLHAKPSGLDPSLLARVAAEPIIRFDALPAGSFVVALEESLPGRASGRRRLVVGGGEIETRGPGRYRTIASVATQLEESQQLEVQLELESGSPRSSDVLLTVDCSQRAVAGDDVEVWATPILDLGPDQDKVELELVASTKGGAAFVADGLRSGTYRLDVCARGGREILWAVFAELAPGQNEYRIELPPTAIRTIRVRDAETNVQVHPEVLLLRLAEAWQEAGAETFRFVRMLTPEQQERGLELAEGVYEVVVAATGYGWQIVTTSVLGDASEVAIRLEMAAGIRVAKPSPEGNVFNEGWIESFSISDQLGDRLEIAGYSPIAIESSGGPVAVAGLSVLHDGICVVEVPALVGVCDEQTVAVTLRRGEVIDLPVRWSD